MLKIYVAPHVGAWIEIISIIINSYIIFVAPHVGAWIEIKISIASLSSSVVAPHVGAWIEIIENPQEWIDEGSRSSRRSVD